MENEKFKLDWRKCSNCGRKYKIPKNGNVLNAMCKVCLSHEGSWAIDDISDIRSDFARDGLFKTSDY